MPASPFIVAIQALDRAAASDSFDGYGPRPIPHDLDVQVEDFVRSYMLAPANEREELQLLPHSAAQVLLAFAERQAALSVRTQSKEVLTLSILAVGLAAEIADDEREGMLVMPLPWHSATLIGLKPDTAFAEAAALLPAKGEQALRAFCRRAPEDQTLSCMGYIESSDQEGFRYERTW